MLLAMVSLDLLVVVLAALLAVISPQEALLFAVAYIVASWIFGGYAVLSWPWVARSRLVQRSVLVVAATVALLWLAGGQGSILLLAVAQLSWAIALRVAGLRLLQARATRRLQASPVHRKGAQLQQQAPAPQRQLLLLFVAYHPSSAQVEQLQQCLQLLPSHIGYAVVANDHRPGEAVDRLAAGADQFLANADNPGYGRAVNRLVASLAELPPHLGVLNTDLSWQPGTFARLLAWLQAHPEVSLAVPQILDETGAPQQLCKHHPTVLALFSRRFLPDRCKPRWLKRYDRAYVMAGQAYDQVFDVPYLSGCCMLMRSDAFCRSGGFDERYFLYLEDADLSRSLALEGRCVHLPLAGVVHGWGRGNYRSLRLMAVNLISAWHYFRKWGWALW